ncbi:Cyclin [Penicillium bovifimosum]|uniref:RNA polymerase II holoenzyme cyclin-like subunit n=1 Tax=Penicillium bovifimosum TaxID=126998 RepID=A0A9W9H1V9_9EURO|nr:Cyclin [Penicillium bovifimosum]KAJ5135291.1 Cyclin [Penicillium bovifimosum]
MASPMPKRRVPGLPNPVLEAEQQKWLFTEEEFERTPSRIDKIERGKEDYIRHRAVEFIWQVSVMLKMPPQTSMTATVYMHRFLMRYSLMGQYQEKGSDLMHPKVIAAVALFVAFKVDEAMRRMKDFVIACCRVAMKQPNLIVDEQSKDYWKWRDLILQNESVMLEYLCFDLQVESPYRILWDYSVFLGVTDNRHLRHSSYSFLNDSTYTVLCLQFPPRVIAAAALYAAARHCKVAFPDDAEGRPWWEQIDVRLDDLIRACTFIVKIYERVQQNLSKGYPDFAISETTSNPNDPTRLFDTDPTKPRPQHSIPPTPSSSLTTQEPHTNGRKRSREPESRPQPPSSPKPASNGNQEPSPKRQRTVTPSPENISTTGLKTLPSSRPRIPAAASSHNTHQPHSRAVTDNEPAPGSASHIPKSESSAEEGEVSEKDHGHPVERPAGAVEDDDGGSEEGEI